LDVKALAQAESLVWVEKSWLFSFLHRLAPGRAAGLMKELAISITIPNDAENSGFERLFQVKLTILWSLTPCESSYR
jgi:hypothetical protein